MEGQSYPEIGRTVGLDLGSWMDDGANHKNEEDGRRKMPG